MSVRGIDVQPGHFRLLRTHVLGRADEQADLREERLLRQRWSVALATPKSITFGTGCRPAPSPGCSTA